MKWKTKAIAVMSCTVAFLGGMTYSNITHNESRADAAVAVVDQENIAQAIKTVLNTTTMLNNETKQIALQILDMASMDNSLLYNYIRQQQNKQDEVWSEQEQKIGPLGRTGSADSYIYKNYGDINSILNGNIPVMTLVNSDDSIKALEATARDALHNAKSTQNGTRSMSQMLNQTISNSQNAEGSKEAIQANTQTVGVNTMATLETNNLLSDAIAQQSMKYAKEARDEAASIAINRAITKSMKNFTDSQVDHSRDTTYEAARDMYGADLAQYYQ